MNIAGYIDHTLLKADATQAQIKELCQEAVDYNFVSVCINPCWVEYASYLLSEADVKVCTVIGFPLGANTTATKVFETENAIENGANEVDMVINISALKSGNWSTVQEDIESVVEAANDSIIVKVIIEACLLTDEEIIRVCQIAKEAGADYVKTSTGFSTGGATVEAVTLMRKTVGPHMGVKASGGVSTPEEARAMIEAGATRIGTSRGVSLVQ